MGKLGKQYRQASRTSQVFLGIILSISVLTISLILWWFRANTQVLKNAPMANTVTPTQEPEGLTEQQSSSVKNDTPKELFASKELQSVLDNWVSGVSGTASVVLMSTEGRLIASLDKDKKYFTASIYKLYVAYAGYMQLDAGLIDASEPYVNGNNRAECLDLMIRESDSPCGEKLWNEVGKSELTKQLEDYAIYNTSMVALNTTAFDTALMLVRVANGEGLTSPSQTALLESMKNQIYRDALNAGFTGETIVYNKIGFRGLNEYHDTAIVEFTDGRRLIVSVLTDGVGTSSIAELGMLIEESIR